jgi:hypothetical protein
MCVILFFMLCMMCICISLLLINMFTFLRLSRCMLQVTRLLRKVQHTTTKPSAEIFSCPAKKKRVLIARHFYHDFDDSKMFFPFSEQLHVSVQLIEGMTDLVYLKSNSVEEVSHHVNKRFIMV